MAANVIRQDVVQISFDILNNPIDTIKDGIKSVQTGVKDMASAAGTQITKLDAAAGGLSDSLTGVADGLENMAKPAKTASGYVKEMVTAFKDGAAAKIKALPENLEAASKSAKELTLSFKNSAIENVKKTTEKIKTGFEDIRKIKLKDVVNGLDTGIVKAVLGAKELAPKIKETAGVSLERLKNEFASVGKEIGSVAAKAGKLAVHAGGKALGGMGRAASAAVKGTAVGLTAAATAVGGIGIASIKTGAEFEASMSQVAATMGMTVEEISNGDKRYKMLADTAKQMGASTKFSASESAEALNYLALAGYDAEKACTALPTILNLASAGGMGLAAASDMITDSMSALGIEATQSNLNEFGDMMAVAAQKSNTSVAQIGEAILTVGGTAKKLSGGTAELNTLLGILADNGVKGSEGGTALRNVLLSLQSPTDAAAKKLKALGVNVFDANGKLRPMNQVLGDFNSAIANMTDQQKTDVISTIFNKNDLKSVEALLTNCGDRFDELNGYIIDSNGAMQNMADVMNDNLMGRITEFKSALEGAGIAIYECLGSGGLKDIVKEAGGWISELTGAAQSGGLEGLVNGVGGIFAKMIEKISSLAPKVIEMGVGLVKSLADGIKDNLPSIATGIVNSAASFIGGIAELFPIVITAGIDLITALGQGAAKALPSLMDTAGIAVGRLLIGITDRLPEFAQTIGGVLESIVKGLSDNLPTLVPIAVKTITTLVQSVVLLLPKVAVLAGDLAACLFESFFNAIPMLAKELPVMINALKDEFPKVAPMLTESAIGLVTALTDGLIEALPFVTEAAVDMLDIYMEAFIQNAPMLVDCGFKIIQCVAEGFIRCLPQILQCCITLIGKLITVILDNAPRLVEAGVAVIGAFIKGIINTTPALGSAVLEAATEMARNFLSYDWISLGGRIISSIFGGGNADLGRNSGAQTAIAAASGVAAGIEQGKSGVMSGMEDVSEGMKEKIKNTDLKSSGINAMRGLNSGIIQEKNNVIAAAASVAAAVESAFNARLDIHSPSRIMQKSGKFVGEGLTIGMISKIPDIKSAGESMGAAAAEPVVDKRGLGGEKGGYYSMGYAPEDLRSAYSDRRIENNEFNTSFNLSIEGGCSERSLERSVKQWVMESMTEFYDSIGRRNPRLTEV